MRIHNETTSQVNSMDFPLLDSSSVKLSSTQKDEDATGTILAKSPMTHIELFAGCGGLSLGFKSENFDLILANELSPMAAETFAYNHLGENLADEPDSTSKTIWLSSNYPKSEMAKRLREEPLSGESRHSDLKEYPPEKIKGSLIVGSIIDLNLALEDNPAIVEALKKATAKKEIDVVSGGPPCQSFSMAGLRNKNSSRNQLPWEFARFVDQTRPRIALLENVTGILRPFSEEGGKFHAWLEVAKAFAKIGYSPICLHINAKNIGAGQNRPRFVMIAIRRDISDKLTAINDPSLSIAIHQGNRLQDSVKSGKEVSIQQFRYFDIVQNSGFFKGPIFKHLSTHVHSFTSVKEAIGDLREKGCKSSSYVRNVNKSLNTENKKSHKWKNHELRKNSSHVQARFRVYQIIIEMEAKEVRMVQQFLKDPEKYPISSSCLQKLLKHEYLNDSRELISFKTTNQLTQYLANLRSKKQTQKALSPDKPAPAALSIPDDACHWDKEHPRTLTVREMARIQSFPDWFIFRSKVTTGGKMRRFEVPQYTQVGNAVPPLLGKALAKVVRELLTRVD